MCYCLQSRSTLAKRKDPDAKDIPTRPHIPVLRGALGSNNSNNDDSYDNSMVEKKGHNNSGHIKV